MRSIRHFGYQASVIDVLLRRGAQVHLMIDDAEESPERDAFLPASEVSPASMRFEPFIRRSDRYRKQIRNLRELHSYVGYLRQPNQSAYYRERWKQYMAWHWRQAVRLPLVGKGLASDWVWRRLDHLEARTPSDEAVVTQLKSIKPDVVVVTPTNARFDEEVEYLKAAQQLRIPTVTPVLTWDNLTTKGVFPIVPDLTLVWNAQHFGEAVRVHRIPPQRIATTGAPFFDKWLKYRTAPTPRDVFFKKLGLSPDRPLVTYLGSSSRVAKDETSLVGELFQALQTHGPCHLLVRPHPANIRYLRGLEIPGVVVWPREGSLATKRQAIDDFADSLLHSDGCVGLNTSGMVDAIALDRPCFALLLPQYDRTQTQALHFQYLLNVGAATVVRDAPSCAQALWTTIRGDDQAQPQRRHLLEEMLWPRGLALTAGAWAAQAIWMLAAGVPATEISGRLDVDSPPTPECSDMDFPSLF